jgi:outer membrane lipoprotein-sorting protein
MNQWIKWNFALIAIVPQWIVVSEAHSQDSNRGLEIARQVDKANSNFVSEVGTAELKLIDAHGGTISRELSLRTLERQDDGDRSIVTFNAPSDVAGTRLLTWAHDSTADDQWLFLPAMNRVKRISSRNKSGSFMGSEFSYEDLAAPGVEEFSYNYLREEKFKGVDTWVYERRSRDADSGYSRQVLWVAKNLRQPVKMQFFDRRNELLKEASFSGFRAFGTQYRPGSIEMSNVQTHKRSVLTWTSLKLGEKISDSDFRPDALGT